MEIEKIKEEDYQTKKRTPLTSIAEILLPHFPDLKEKLKMADMKESSLEFMEKIISSTVGIAIGLILIFYILIRDLIFLSADNNPLMLVLYLVAPLVIIPMVIFFYLTLYPTAAKFRRQQDINNELVFAGRHIAIALKSGMPLFDSLVGASRGYGAVSKELSRIIDKIVLGTPITQAIRETTQSNPSSYFNRMMMQMANSISSGADVGSSLEGVLDQISKEQLISLKEYSQKLTPLVMFYMVFGIVVPSLGIVLMTVILSSISGGTLGFTTSSLLTLGAVTALIQILFLGFIESSRPKYLI